MDVGKLRKKLNKFSKDELLRNDCFYIVGNNFMLYGKHVYENKLLKDYKKTKMEDKEYYIDYIDMVDYNELEKENLKLLEKKDLIEKIINYIIDNYNYEQ